MIVQRAIQMMRPSFRFVGVLVLWIGSVVSTCAQVISCNVTNTELSEPLNFFLPRVTVTNYCPGSPAILFETITAPALSFGYQFTHWTLNGQRVQNFTGESVNPAPLVFTNNISAVAHYVPANQYTADDLVPDWYKIAYFNTTNID